MTPIDFKGTNVILSQDQSDYVDLPAYMTLNGDVLSCWQLTFWERVKMLFTGVIWHWAITGDYSTQPVWLTTTDPIGKVTDD